MDRMNSIVITILVFVVLNLILWGAQELFWHKDTQEINNIKVHLESEKAQIALLESSVSDQSEYLKQKEHELDYLKSQALIAEYNAGVREYNSLLRKYKASVDAYNSKLVEYNEQVSRCNELTKKSGSRWYIIPIPIPRSLSK